MNIDKIVQINNELQLEGKNLLDELDLVKRLSKFGITDIGGSFVYGTMVDRDIDIAVLTDKLSYGDRSKFIAELLMIPQVSRVSMVDYVNHPRDDRGRTIWVGLTVPYRNQVWTIDLTLAQLKSPDVHSNMLLHKKMLKISERERIKILRLKNKSLTRGKKVKGKTSSEIYKRVLRLEK